MTQPHNTIRTFALVCVAISTAFVIGMGIWLTTILTGRDWCALAVGAAKSAEGAVRPEYAVSGCFGLLKQQVSALAFNSHIYAATIGFCLLALMVIVVAGGRLSFKASATGVEGNIGEAGEAADKVAGAAVEKAEEIKERAP